MKLSAFAKIEIFACLALGIVAGLGFYTFDYAKGLSYFSNNPRACMNCHIMRDQYESWTKSSHHQAAKCNDCHIPHAFPWKYVEKSRNGWNHSKAFTLQNFPEPIRISDHNLKILQANCIHCHDDMVSELTGHRGVALDTVRCTECHRSVGHMSLD
ncbi:MAG: cytochrome c nitrite reductase small subunit [Omnitrophica bacterium GWA2_52_12]|nr:MAG: cytochrome c nitrite reductase small subunit [Omnitrophica bacterium GWA2_52_12]